MKVSHKYKQALEKHWKTVRRAKKEHTLHEALEAPGNKCTYPNGVKPFKTPPNMIVLEAKFQPAVDADFQVTCTIKKDSLLKDALLQTHHWMTRFHKAIIAQAWDKKNTNHCP